MSASSKRILAILGQNENSALDWGSKGFGHVLSSRGYEHVLIDMFKPAGSAELMDHLKSGEVLFAYGYAGVGSQFNLTSGANLWTASRTPFLALWYDHPAYNYYQHIVDSPYIVHAYHIRDHIEVRRRYIPRGTSGSVLLPVRFDIGNPAHHLPFRDRERKILYVKTGKNPESISADWQRHGPELQQIIRHLVETAKKDRMIDLVGTAQQILSGSEKTANNLKLCMGVVAEADDYIRAWRSDRLARALINFPCHIVGRGWDYLKDEGTAAEFSSPVSMQQYIDMIPRYRINANSNPLWRYGVHDRTHFSMHFGCVTLTDRTVTTDEIFGGLRNYVPFDWQDDLDAVVDVALRRSDEDDSQYLKAAAEAVERRLLSKTPDYHAEILRLVDAVHRQMPFDGIGLSV